MIEHTARAFDADLRELAGKIGVMGSLAEKQITDAIEALRKRDLALIVSEVPATVAGMFTTNQVCAAPVKVCAERVRCGTAQAIVVNSGNANACTGQQGMKDARAMTAVLARQLHLPEQHVLVGSTGRIGVTLPMANVRSGSLDAVTQLDHATASADHAANR